MQIKSLHIKSHKHLQNLDFDFTYPKGHDKEGKPLDKICIIGQSATGKTSLLEIIRNSISNLSFAEFLNNDIYLMSFRFKEDAEIEFLYNNEEIKISKQGITKGEKLYQPLPKSGGGFTDSLFPKGFRLVYLNADIISKNAIEIFNRNPLNIINEIPAERYAQVQNKFYANYIYEFGQDVNAEVWFSLLYKILDYRKRFTQMASELINKGAIGDMVKLNQQFTKWSEANENPLVPFANHINPILKKLNLEIDLINTEYPIPIRLLNDDKIIPVENLSTGTKGLLLSMFPLYELDTKDSMILLDEPERSLFPDLQIDLLSYHQKLAPEAQFIVATHSPFIAASFEPEERFILYFDAEGKVAVRRGTSPIGDDPNDMLANDFQVDYYNAFGKRAYQQYLDLKRKVAEETEPARKKELIVELAELGDKYNF